MDELKVTWERAVAVWWSITWRSTLLVFAAALGTGFLIGLFGAMLHLDKGFLHRLSLLAGVVGGAAIGIWVVKRVLTKRFSDFRIVLKSLE